MKYRTDFVTNSSSSSFIISLKENSSNEFLKLFTELKTTKDIINIFDAYDVEEELENIQKVGNFTEEQMEIIQAIQLEFFDEFLALKEMLKEKKQLFYGVFDWDYLYDKDELKEFIHENKVLQLED